MVTASIGVLRFPDFYSRIHPAGTSDTLGQIMILLSLIIYEGFSLVSVKLLLIIIFLLITNPTAMHAIAKASYFAGIKPWKKNGERND